MIRLGEDSGAEFKEVRFSGDRVVGPSRERLAKEISAMANAKGGWLVLGVDNKTRKVLGIPVDRLDTLSRFVEETCNDAIKPALVVDIYRRELPDELGTPVPVLAVRVEQSPYVHQTNEGYFYRVGSSARAMQTDFVLRLHQERSLSRIRRFEELPVPHTGLETLRADLWRRFVSPREHDAEVALLKRNLLARNADGVVQASVLGLLMCSEEPKRHVPNAYIQAVRYRGTTQNSHFQVDAKDITGPLDQQVHDAMVFFRLNQRIAATKEMGRRDFPQFSEKAILEAIVNAVAHRDYAIDHSHTRFFIFDDRIEIYSPGSLVNSMTTESMRYRTATRNERVTNLLAECPLPESLGDLGRTKLMERRGDGVNIIFDEAERLGAPRPIYRLLDDAELMLTIFAAPIPNQDATQSSSSQ
jgi:predicted HTH transcriptional regulator